MLVPVTEAAAQQEIPAGPRTNLDILQSIVTQLADEILAKSGAAKEDSLYLNCTGNDECWIAEHPLGEAGRKKGNAVFNRPGADAPAGITIDVVPTMRVGYGPAVDRNLFGTQTVERLVTVDLSYRAVRNGTGEVLAGGAVAGSRRDTIETGMIPSLEQSPVKSTVGLPPEGSFLDRIVQPFIIIGAVGTMIFLLFHVRS